MTSYICKNCSYRLESDRPRKTCPYCGEDELEVEKNATELLDGVDRS